MGPLVELLLLNSSQISDYGQFGSYWAQNLKVSTLYFKIIILKNRFVTNLGHKNKQKLTAH